MDEECSADNSVSLDNVQPVFQTVNHSLSAEELPKIMATLGLDDNNEVPLSRATFSCGNLKLRRLQRKQAVPRARKAGIVAKSYKFVGRPRMKDFPDVAIDKFHKNYYKFKKQSTNLETIYEEPKGKNEPKEKDMTQILAQHKKRWRAYTALSALLYRKKETADNIRNYLAQSDLVTLRE